jgi:acetolactate synthase-1/2/3 large subunit
MPSRDTEDREAFQEIEVKQLFSSYVKWAAVIRDTARIPEYVSHAFHIARSGRPGPVVLGLPEDMLAADCEIADAKAIRIAEAHPGAAAMAELQERLAKAQRPLMIVGGPGWSVAAKAAVEAFADRFDLPVAPAFRYQDYIDNRHRCHVGCAGIGMDPKLAAAIRDADLLIVVGARLGEMTTAGYTLIAIPNPAPYLVHITPRRTSWARSIAPTCRLRRALAHSRPRSAPCSLQPAFPGAAAVPSCAPPTSRALFRLLCRAP